MPKSMPGKRGDRMTEPTEDDSIDSMELHWAAQAGDVAVVVELIAQGHAIDRFDELGMTPLHHAVAHGHLRVCEVLLQAGADVNAHDERRIGNTPLGEVAATCSLEMAVLLVDSGADPTIPGWMQLTAVDKACDRVRGDGPEVCEYLREAARRCGGGCR